MPGPICCLLGVCCAPEQRAAALATFLHQAGSEATEKDFGKKKKIASGTDVGSFVR